MNEMIKTLALATVLAATAGSALACDAIASKTLKLSACVDTDWVVQTPQGAQEFLYFSSDETIGLAVIAEQETPAVADFRAAILSNAAAAVTGNLSDVTIIGERIENVSGKPWNVIEYEVSPGGQALRFQNFYYVQPGFGATQFVLWSTPSDVSSAAYRAGQLLATVQIGG